MGRALSAGPVLRKNVPSVRDGRLLSHHLISSPVIEVI